MFIASQITALVLLEQISIQDSFTISFHSEIKEVIFNINSGTTSIVIEPNKMIIGTEIYKGYLLETLFILYWDQILTSFGWPNSTEAEAFAIYRRVFQSIDFGITKDTLNMINVVDKMNTDDHGLQNDRIDQATNYVFTTLCPVIANEMTIIRYNNSVISQLVEEDYFYISKLPILYELHLNKPLISQEQDKWYVDSQYFTCLNDAKQFVITQKRKRNFKILGGVCIGAGILYAIKKLSF